MAANFAVALILFCSLDVSMSLYFFELEFTLFTNNYYCRAQKCKMKMKANFDKMKLVHFDRATAKPH